MSFSPYARCLKMGFQNLTDEEKSNMWWQKSDYDDFARVGRIISKAMLEGGSKVWLTSKSSLSSPTISGSDIHCDSTTKDDTTIDSLLSSTGIVNPLLHHDNISERKEQEFYEMQDKWWHKFGHSRRGLEHFDSNTEGRQRYLNGRSAIRSVMEEQQRQMMFLPKGHADIDKFRTVYLRETRWAKILSRAAGESDENAVQTNFDFRRKPREYYLKKHFDNNSNYVSTSNEIHLPIFMKAIITTKRTKKNLNLDANTISQIRFRKSQAAPVSSKLQEKKNKRSEGKAKTKALNKSANRVLITANKEKESVDNDATYSDDASISSISTEDSSSSLAKIAAGWGVDESKEDMSSVLIGMGISSKPSQTVG